MLQFSGSVITFSVNASNKEAGQKRSFSNALRKRHNCSPKTMRPRRNIRKTKNKEVMNWIRFVDLNYYSEFCSHQISCVSLLCCFYLSQVMTVH